MDTTTAAVAAEHELEGRLAAVLDSARQGLASVRAGRVDASAFSRVSVDYYGARLPLGHMATLAFPSANLALVKPHDKTTLTSVRKALRDADLGADPSDDGAVIRLAFPDLTGERRAELVKVARARAEEGRVALRAARRDARAGLDALELPEGELARARKHADALTTEAVSALDELLRRKEAALLEV
jgi:ribosome recycling factor